MRPLSMVEDVGFKAIVSTFHPKYELPSRTFFTKQKKTKKTRTKQEGESTDLVGKECSTLSNIGRAGKVPAVYSSHINAIRASVFSCR